MNLQKLAELFATHFGQALEMMSGEKPATTVEAAAVDQLAPDLLVWEQPFNLDGVCAWLAGAEDAWIALGAQLLKSAGIEDADAPTSKSTFLETLNQAFSGVARELTTLADREIAPSTGREGGTPPAGRSWCRMEVSVSPGAPTALLITFSKEAESIAGSQSAGAPQTLAPTVAAPRALPGLENSRTLELLLDVELPVSVSFGRAQLPLKDVIKLTSGSIIELNRTVGEPVEIIVNNCVIARGEVVVVEGNFGVRIQHVISKQERLRTLY